MNINQKGIKVKLAEHNTKTPTLRAGFFAVLANALRGQGTRAPAAGAGPDGPAAHLLNAESTLAPQLSPNAADNLGVNGVAIDNSERFRPSPGTGERISGFDPAAPAATVRTDTPDGTEPFHRLHRDEHFAPANRGWLTAALSAAAFLTLFLLSTTAQSALALTNPERHYEQVSPVYKGGYGALAIEGVSPNGETVLFRSPGDFADAPSGVTTAVASVFDYVSHRESSGWSTRSLLVPPALFPFTGDVDVSPTLSLMLAAGRPGPNLEAAFQDGKKEEFALHPVGSPDTIENWGLDEPFVRTFPEETVGIRYEGASPDFCHVAVSDVSLQEANGHGFFLPGEGSETGKQIYDVTRGCNGEPAVVRRINSDNSGNTLDATCPAEVGISGNGGYYNFEGRGVFSTFNAIADDGQEIFFTTAPKCAERHQLYLRLGDEKTIEVSKPLSEACSVPCPSSTTRGSADFVGASEDGSVVYFESTAPLEPATGTDENNDLYMARIGCPTSKPGCIASEREVTSLTQVSHDLTAGQAAEVQGPVRVAPDGERAYFVARGDLLSSGAETALAGEGRAVPQGGADNLYVHDDMSGQTSFIGDLCSGKELSGLVKDSHCPATQTDQTDVALWGGEGEAQSAGSDARYLVFSTYAQLVPGDTNAHQDVYRYDAVTGTLRRISIGEKGYDSNGNADLLGENGEDLYNALIEAGHSGGHNSDANVRDQYELNNRAISEDGSRIVFASQEPLSPAATNGLSNAYEWREEGPGGEGEVSLISSGNADEPVTTHDLVISPNGEDVFFVTSEGLVPQDTDGAPDVYDARIGGGFSVAAAEPQPCEGDACQGPLTNPAPLLVPGSAVQTPSENSSALPPSQIKVKPKAKTSKCSHGRKLNHGKCVNIKRKKTTKRKINKSNHKGSK